MINYNKNEGENDTRLRHGYEYTKYKMSQYDDGYVQ